MADGFFQGGFAKGVAGGREQALNRDALTMRGELGKKQLALEEKRLKSDDEKKQAGVVRQRVGDSMKNIAEAIKSLREAKKSPDEIASVLKGHIDSTADLLNAAGGNGELLRQSLMAQAMQPPKGPEFETKAREKVGGLVAEAEARSKALGISLEQAQRDVGLRKDKPEDDVKKLTELQSKTIKFYERMTKANDRIADFEAKGVQSPGLIEAVAREVSNPIANLAVSKEGRLYVNAAREWISGVLRADSGAAVPEPEFWRYFKTYFPQYGDDAATITQKAQMRRDEEANMVASSGGLIKDRNLTGEEQAMAGPGLTKENAIQINSEAEADKLPPGTWVNLNGRVGRVK